MKKYARGISLIEALITLLVLSIGLLGLGQLQARLWSGSGRLHASGNAYLLGTAHLEILSARQTIDPALVAEPPLHILLAGTQYNSITSFSENTQLAEISIRVEWQNRNGLESVSLASIRGTARPADTRLLLAVD